MKHAFYNGRVYTGELPLQEAFLVEDGYFSFVGSTQEVLAMEADSRTDLQGRFVCPGFNDSHMHLLGLGRALSVAPLWLHTGSMEEMLQCLLRQGPAQGGWILGRGWNQDLFTDEKRMPDRHDLDKVSEDCPVCATRACGHALCLNSKALELLGITADTPQPEGGEIGMKDGAPNGLLFDNAMDLVTQRLPVPEKEELKQIMEEEKDFHMECQFCDTVYAFSKEELEELIEKI